ncbi:R-spondin-4 [Denticeps clupeoides]|uniref:R-spondin Fu-CRD domain-containing protein n=1 Tax=Denticeps clupeoides TaxID=299321 RepID=A0AAY4EUL6_9TELE|nr:R-spondin-2-like [Denticeps clupeoides]
MHLRLRALLSLLHCVFIATARRAAKDNVQDCWNCLECSVENGCVRCPEKLFLFLQRWGITHRGSCLHSCPAGHFGQRGKDVNRCMKCKGPECDRCFNKDFCTKCKRGLLLFKGRCFSSCPEGTVPHLTDCIEGNWSQWSPCQRNGLSCGVKWGWQIRTRLLPWKVSEESALLHPPQSERKRCRINKRCSRDMRKHERRQKAQKLLKHVKNRTVTDPSEVAGRI